MRETEIQGRLKALRPFPTVESFLAWAEAGPAGSPRGFWMIDTWHGVAQRVSGPHLYSGRDHEAFFTTNTGSWPGKVSTSERHHLSSVLNIPAKGLFASRAQADEYLAAAREAFSRDPEWAADAALGAAIMDASMQFDDDYEGTDAYDDRLADDERETCTADDGCD